VLSRDSSRPRRTPPGTATTTTATARSSNDRRSPRRHAVALPGVELGRLVPALGHDQQDEGEQGDHECQTRAAA
jgi:hypothetical protein